MTARSKRKITLYHGNEAAFKIAVNSLTSNAEVLRIVDNELKRMPLATHALIRDGRGRYWQLERYSSWWQRLKFRLLAG
jgi:hypothetical protein